MMFLTIFTYNNEGSGGTPSFLYTVQVISPSLFYCIPTGFLSRLPHPNLILSRLKGKCSEYERHIPNDAVNSALQTKRQRGDARNENGESTILSVKLIRLDLCVVAGKS